MNSLNKICHFVGKKTVTISGSISDKDASAIKYTYDKVDAWTFISDAKSTISTFCIT